MLNDSKPGVFTGGSSGKRTLLYGMDYREAPVTADYQGDRTAAEVLCAREHETTRLDAVGELFSLIAVLSKTGLLGKPTNVTLGTTTFQWGQGSRDDRTAAAHCLPGQLVFDSFRPDQILGQAGEAAIYRAGVKSLQVDAKLRNLFAQTDLTSTEMNRADSTIESWVGNANLKTKFPEAAKLLLREMGGKPADLSWDKVREAVEKAWQRYRKDAAEAARKGSEITRAKIKINPGRKAAYDLRCAILNAYLDTDRSHSQAKCTTYTGFNDLLRDVLVNPPQ